MVKATLKDEKPNYVARGREDAVAEAIFDALRRADPAALIEGEPHSGRTTIDGTFNLEVVARLVLYELMGGDAEKAE